MSMGELTSYPTTEPVHDTADVSFRILGPLEVAVGERRVVVGGQQATLLGYLLTQAPRVVSLSHLMDAIWTTTRPTRPGGWCRTRSPRCAGC